ncbi:fructose-bisphosphatase class II [Escherichia coli]
MTSKATTKNRRIGEQELARCKAMGIEAGKVLRLGDMARSDNVIFSATGITKGDLLEGISRKGNIATTETLLIRGRFTHHSPHSVSTLWIAKTRRSRCTSSD